MIRSNEFQFENEVPWEDLNNGIQRQVYGYDDTLMLVKAKFITGAVGVMHQHHHSQVTYVDSGVFEMTIGDEKRSSKKAMVIMFRQMYCMVVFVLNRVF
jgi:quercetin dioxygenase-like cupin family protein